MSREYSDYDFSAHFRTLAQIADEKKCDAILFSLFTWHTGGFPLTPSSEFFFGKAKYLQTVILEAGDLETETTLQTLVWNRCWKKPLTFIQRFKRGSDSPEHKKALMDQFDKRVLGQTFTLICGEANILKVSRSKGGKIVDELEFRKKLNRAQIKLIFSPWHSKCFRYEINEKRKALSRGRTVVCVWNEMKERGREGKVPWIVFQNGKNITQMVEELHSPIGSRRDIRVGLISLK